VSSIAHGVSLPTPGKLKGSWDSHIMRLNDVTSMETGERLNMRPSPSLFANSKTAWSNKSKGKVVPVLN
jgi:hypothetical protein